LKKFYEEKIEQLKMYVKRIGREEKIMCAAAAMGTKVYACYHEKKIQQKNIQKLF